MAEDNTIKGILDSIPRDNNTDITLVLMSGERIHIDQTKENAAMPRGTYIEVRQDNSRVLLPYSRIDYISIREKKEEDKEVGFFKIGKGGIPGGFKN